MKNKFEVTIGIKAIVIVLVLNYLFQVLTIFAMPEITDVGMPGKIAVSAIVLGLILFILTSLWRGIYWAIWATMALVILNAISARSLAEKMPLFYIMYIFFLWALWHLWDCRKSRCVP